MTPNEFAHEVIQLDRLLRVRDTAGDRGLRESAQHLIDCKLVELSQLGVLAWYGAFRDQDVAGWKQQDAMGTPEHPERIREMMEAIQHCHEVVPEDVREAVNHKRREEELRLRAERQATLAKGLN